MSRPLSRPLSRLAAALFALALFTLTACADDARPKPEPDPDPDTDTGLSCGANCPDSGGGDVGYDADRPDADGTCQDECDTLGQTDCTDGGVRECVEQDGCLRWSAPTACASNATCSDGQCRASCPDQPCTTLGARQCQNGGVAECVDEDGDGCLDWSAPTACDGGETCSSGYCAVDCTDECTTVGARQCQGNAVAECGNFDGDSCLEWGDTSDCGDEFCVGGRCETSCTDECSSTQARRCDGDGYQTCDDFDSDGCLEWGTTVTCAGGESCSSGFCAQTCSDECTTTGARSCSGDSVVTCGDHDTDNCLEWGSPVLCTGGQVCSSGYCSQNCSDECTVDGAKNCDPSGGVITCGNHDSDACLEWSDPVACGGSEVCNGGNCTLTCTDECSSVGERQCASGNTTDFQTCDDHDADGCLEWGSAQSCPSGEVCSGGNCAQTCSDECSTDGASECVDADSTHTCGDYDSDGCLEWGTTVFCTASQSCQSGSCVDDPPPTGLTISEVFYDAVSSDDDAFVEIHGPAGTDLSGVTLVGINGNGGTRYNEIQLSGTIGSDGLFVVANPSASNAILSEADMTDSDADYQNGPDSIQLEFGSTILDAVGYGTFGSGEVFAGEGSPATDVASGHSLTRDSSFTDTDDNSADFIDDDSPTPGAAYGGNPTPTSSPPTALMTAIPTSSTSVLVDASPSHDDVTPRSSLEVRWDWDDDGSWDTSWSTTKTATHSYTTSSTVTIGLQVRDADGQTDSTKATVDLTQSSTNVSGSISTDTTWSGDVVMLNDVTVETGATLTIDPGTRVMVLHVEDDSDVHGDVALHVEGSLAVNGTASAPVLFTPYEQSRKYAGSWEGIYNEGDMQSSGLIVEYAQYGVRSTTSGQTISDVEARLNLRGFFGRGDNLNLQNWTLEGNDYGIWIGCNWWNDEPGDCSDGAMDQNATISLSDVVASRNGVGLLVQANKYDSISLFQVTATNNTHGIRVDSVSDLYGTSGTGSVTLQRSTVSDNTDFGIFVGEHPESLEVGLGTFGLSQTDIERNKVGVRTNVRYLGGSVEYNNIRDNEYAGIIIDGRQNSGGWGSPTNNNIEGNGTAAGVGVVSVNKEYSEVGGTHDWTWSTSGGEDILAFYGNMEDTWYSANDGEFRVDDSTGLLFLRGGWYADYPDGNGGTIQFKNFTPSYELSDTIYIELRADTSRVTLRIRDIIVFDPTATPTDVAVFDDITLTGNYLGDPSTASSRVFAAPNVTADTSGLLTSEVTSAGR